MNLSLRAAIPAAALLALGFATPALAQGSFDQNLAKAQRTLSDIDSLTTRIVERNAKSGTAVSSRTSRNPSTAAARPAGQRARRANAAKPNRRRRTTPNRKNP